MDVLECPLRITYTRVTFINRLCFLAIVVTVSYRCRIVFITRHSIIELINWHVCNRRWSCCSFREVFQEDGNDSCQSFCCRSLADSLEHATDARCTRNDDPADRQWERRNDSGRRQAPSPWPSSVPADHRLTVREISRGTPTVPHLPSSKVGVVALPILFSFLVSSRLISCLLLPSSFFVFPSACYGALYFRSTLLL